MKNKSSAHPSGSGRDNNSPNIVMAKFNNFLAEQIPSLRRYAVALRGPLGDHDELVRDTLVEALNQKKSFDPDGNIKLWLLGILHQVFVNAYSNKLSNTSAIPLDISFDALSNASQSKELDIPDVEFALALISDEKREIFLLAGLEGLTYKEISQVLNIPMGSLVNKLIQARKAVKEIVYMGTAH